MECQDHKFGVGSIVFLIGSPGSGKTTFARQVARHPERFAVLPRPRRLVMDLGSAAGAGAESFADSFDETAIGRKVADELKEDAPAYRSTLAVLDDFVAFTPAECRDLFTLLLHRVRHHRLLILLSCHVVSGLPLMTTLLQQATNIVLFSSPSNVPIAGKVGRMLGYEEDKIAVMKKEVVRMVRRRSASGVYESMAVNLPHYRIYHDFQNLAADDYEKSGIEVTSMAEPGSRQYVLVPKSVWTSSRDPAGAAKEKNSSAAASLGDKLAEKLASHVGFARCLLAYLTSVPGVKVSLGEEEGEVSYRDARAPLTRLVDQLTGRVGDPHHGAVRLSRLLSLDGYPLPSQTARDEEMREDSAEEDESEDFYAALSPAWGGSDLVSGEDTDGDDEDRGEHN